MKLSFLLWLASALPQPVSDQVCLATTVYLEARSESQTGQMAVAEVAMRRRESGRWGSTVCNVVRAPGQFATGTLNENIVLSNPVAWHKAWNVAGRVMATWSLPNHKRKFVVPDAYYFVVSDSVWPSWIKGPPLTTIGAHSFYAIN